MNVFDIISLLGGLAMFLYGMRLLGNGLKEGSSGTLKVVLEKFTNNPVKAFLLGLFVTAVIQSSTATIVITSGLVAAGIIAFDKSLGIVIGANVGTTVTGQIIRLLDLENNATSFLRIFEPSTLAPLALLFGIILIMGFKFRRSNIIGSILIGFGILFTGLLSMRSAVNALNDAGILTNILTDLGDAPVLAYLSAAAVAFILQSSSATIGILQSFAGTGGIHFNSLYIMLTGIYLGDCVTTAIVCSIGAKKDAQRVGLVNIMFNLSETVLVLVLVNVVKATGAIDALWNEPMTSGTIANTNTVFNLGCAILLLPLVGVYGKLSKIIIKDKPAENTTVGALINGLNPVFYSTPALALRSCYDVLKTSIDVAVKNINLAMENLSVYSAERSKVIEDNENTVDELTDAVSDYMAKLYPNISDDHQIHIINQYYKLTNEFERLSDHAVNIDETAGYLYENKLALSAKANAELDVLYKLLGKILDYSTQAFLRRDVDAARHIEPLEEVMDDLINATHDNHLERLRSGLCSVQAGVSFLDILSNLERISDTCSNIGVATITRVHPELVEQAHSYTSQLHQGKDEVFNAEYHAAHDEYFKMLESVPD